MPIIGAIMIINVALGVLVKAVPQMNIFVVGMPIKVLAGLFLLLLVLAPALGFIFNYIFDAAYHELIHIMWMMTP